MIFPILGIILFISISLFVNVTSFYFKKPYFKTRLSKNAYFINFQLFFMKIQSR
jgi:hypothetical protein